MYIIKDKPVYNIKLIQITYDLLVLVNCRTAVFLCNNEKFLPLIRIPASVPNNKIDQLNLVVRNTW